MGFKKEGSKPPTHIILDNIRIFGKDSLQIKRKKRVIPRKNKSKVENLEVIIRERGEINRKENEGNDS